MGPSGRKFLLERPFRDEVEETLWRMVFDARRREDDLKREWKDRSEKWLKQERNLREWKGPFGYKGKEIG